MPTATPQKTRKPQAHLAAAVHGHTCLAIPTVFVEANQADRPMEAGS